MTQDGEFVVFFRQRGVAFASAFLFDRQEAGVVPEETFAVLVKEGFEIAPGHRAQRGMASALQARDMSGGVSAAIGDHQERLGVEVMLQ